MAPRLLYSRVLTELNISEKRKENQSPQMFDLDVDDEFTDGMSDPGQI